MAIHALDAYVFGYRRISCAGEQRAALATALVFLGISSYESNNGEFIIREADFKRFRAYAAGRIRYSATPVLGIFGAFIRLGGHIPSLLALLLSLVGVFLLSGLVWDVRVEGEDKLGEEEIREMLSSAGFGIGTLWGEVDTAEIEAEVRGRYPDVAWMQINRSGTVAYVTVREREGGENGADIYSPSVSNLVADRDGVIEEITVRSGSAAVKPGDVVKKGDILISGVIDDDGESRLVRAEGYVIARSLATVSASAERTEYIDGLTDGGCIGVAVEIFGRAINIYKKYGNLDDGCVIIDDEGEYLSLADTRLPIRIKRQYLSYRVREEQRYTDSELPTLAAERLRSILSDALSDADLIKLRTSGGYTDVGYAMTAEYVYSASIGREVEIVIGR